MRWLNEAWQDVRYAARSVLRTPVFAIVAVVTIGLGVGATTSLFSVANAVLFRALPVSEPDRLVSIQERRTGAVSTGIEGWAVPYRRYLAYREATHNVFVDLAAHRYASLSLRAGGAARPAAATLISANYFAVLGVQPQLGRVPVSDDEPVVVLSHAAWQDRFAGAGGVIGQPVSVDGHAFVIAGVAPPGFRGTVPGLSMDLWLPHEAYPPGSPSRWVVPFGRLAGGIERKNAQSAVNVIGLRIPPDEAHTVVRHVGLETLGGLPRDQGGRQAASLVAVLVATAALVLLIACGNIAGMLLARAVARRREIAVRLAVGATRGRLIRQLLTETLALFLAGGALGVLMAFGATRAMAGLRPPVPDLGLAFDFAPDGRVLGLALFVSVATAIVFGLAPAVGATRLRLVPALKDGAGSAGRQGARTRSAFVVGQLALAVLLLVVAGLLVRSLRNGLAVDPGFRAEGVVVATTNLVPHGYDEARGRAFHEQLVARVVALPGVEAAVLAEWVLLAGAPRGRGQDVQAADAGPDGPAPTAWFSAVDTAYFGTLRIPLIAGRGFTAADRPGSAPVVVVNQTLAQRLWPSRSAIGRRLRAGPTAYQVIGIARDGKYTSVNERPQSVAFFPYAQTYAGRMALHVRTRGGTAETIRGIRDLVQALDPNVAVEGAGSLRTMVDATLFPQRFVAGLVALLGLLGLLLSAVGVYGVLMYSVTQRIREFGIRVALGASAGAVTRGVVAHGAKLAAGGAVLGLAGAAAVTRVLRFWLIGVGPLDPVTFVSVPCILAAVSLLAVYHPVRRALRADPLQAMRAE